MRYLSFFILFISIYQNTRAQSELSKWEINGYLSNMQSVMILDASGNWINDNLFHNRINIFWYPVSNIETSVQFRNRFMYGQTIQTNPDYVNSIDNVTSFLDLPFMILDGKSFFLNTNIDRAYLKYSMGKFVSTIGRQRINWAQTFVWNPNDIFNVYNFFDFDYIEKPGSDAIRLQYYSSFTSTIEVAAKLDHHNKLTAAGYYRFNTVGYDFQVLGGILSENDYFGGLGWSGDIKGAGFRGEMTYIHPKENFRDTSGIFYLAVSGDYTFSNSLNIQCEGLYSKLPSSFRINSFLDYYSGPLTVKNLAFSKWNIFTQVSYPLTPLLNASVSFMYFDDLKGYYSGPSIDYSIKDNITMSIISQIFSGDFNTGSMRDNRNTFFLGFLRYKYNF